MSPKLSFVFVWTALALRWSGSRALEDWDATQRKWSKYIIDPHYDVPTLDLQKGTEIPALGYGTYQVSGKPLIDALIFALRLGYRHIDTAIYYENHHDVAKAVSKSGVPRDQIFITSKIPINMLGYESAKEAIQQMRRELETKTIDLCLIHFPGDYSVKDPHESGWKRKGTWQALEESKDEGICTNIGVSNFEVGHLKEVLKYSRIKPMVNQIEFHPYFVREELLDFCKDKHIAVSAYASLSPRGNASFPSKKHGAVSFC